MNQSDILHAVETLFDIDEAFTKTRFMLTNDLHDLIAPARVFEIGIELSHLYLVINWSPQEGTLAQQIDHMESRLSEVFGIAFHAHRTHGEIVIPAPNPGGRSSDPYYRLRFYSVQSWREIRTARVGRLTHA